MKALSRRWGTQVLCRMRHDITRPVAHDTDIMVVGANVIDMIAYVPRFPQAGETLHGTDFQTGFGGKGANQAVAAARLGSKVAIATRVGSDTNGQETIKNFEENGVSTALVSTSDDRPTGVAPITVDDSGSNQIVVIMGANDQLTASDVEQARNAIRSSKLLLCQLEVPLETSLAALRVAKEEGVVSILNTAPARETLPQELLSLATIVCPNQPELALLTGLPTDTIEQATIAAQELLKQGPEQVLCTLGKDGCMLVSRDGSQLHVPATDDMPIDTVGAGDAFLGAFAHFYTESEGDMKQSMQLANQVSGLSVTRRGTQTSFPFKHEL